MSQTELTFDSTQAQERRDEGMQRAMDHADAVEIGWTDMAYNFLVNVYIRHHRGAFMTEDVRAACAGVVPEPPSNRAWGGIISKARNAGLIKSIGTRQVKNKNANRAFASVWQRI